MSTVMVCFHPTEFAALLKISGFNLPANVIIKLVKEADVNGDALIQYRGSLILKAMPTGHFALYPAELCFN